MSHPEDYARISQKIEEQIPELDFGEIDPDIIRKWHASEEVDEDFIPRKKKSSLISKGHIMVWPFLIKWERGGSGYKIKLYHMYQNRDKFLASAFGLEGYEFQSILARLKEIISTGGLKND